jgi:hypothetical protein
MSFRLSLGVSFCLSFCLSFSMPFCLSLGMSFRLRIRRSTLMAIIPTAAERASVKFTFGSGWFWQRYVMAAALFLLGSWLWLFTSAGFLGLIVVLLGHFPVWARSQQLAPGGATPDHENVWAPTDEDWYQKVCNLEAKGERWDTSPFDITSIAGFGGLMVAAMVCGVLMMVMTDEPDRVVEAFGILLPFLVLPIWFNGIRQIWHPSELRNKGEALDQATNSMKKAIQDKYEPIPMLALREGARGRYPVDARLMLRPIKGKEGFLGIQVQVAMNNVRGTDYPYLYCVVLAKKGCNLPPIPPDGEGMVYEAGQDGDVSYIVVRQHADNNGGWHTDRDCIDAIVKHALKLASKL